MVWPVRRGRRSVVWRSPSGRPRVISNAFGGLQTLGGNLLWYLTLLTGFWILSSTQLGIMDLLSRTVTDILWTSNPGVRRWAKGDVRKVYYSTLVVFVFWGCIAINLAQPRSDRASPPAWPAVNHRQWRGRPGTPRRARSDHSRPGRHLA